MREKREEGGGEVREEGKVSVVYLQYFVGLDYKTSVVITVLQILEDILHF